MSILKRKWKRMNEVRYREKILKPKKRIRYNQGERSSMRIPMRKKFTPIKIEDQIKEIIFLRSTGTSVKDIASLLEVSPEMARDVLKHKALYEKSIALKQPLDTKLLDHQSDPDNK